MAGYSHPHIKSMSTNKMEFLKWGEISKHLSAAAVMHMLAVISRSLTWALCFHESAPLPSIQF